MVLRGLLVGELIVLAFLAALRQDAAFATLVGGLRFGPFGFDRLLGGWLLRFVQCGVRVVDLGVFTLRVEDELRSALLRLGLLLQERTGFRVCFHHLLRYSTHDSLTFHRRAHPGNPSVFIRGPRGRSRTVMPSTSRR